MGVLLQAFYWDCPGREQREHAWWPHLEAQLPKLADAGFTALWLPPPGKGMHATGMGYDPYDYFDLGEFDQKGSVPTWFGTRAELHQLIESAHQHGLSVIADMVLNHNSGADAEEVNPINGQKRWTLFQPKSGRFPRNWESFHPSMYESWDEMTFGDMPDLSHRNPYVYGELLKFARWLIEEVGFDGFRYDFVKGFAANTITAIQEYRYMKNGAYHKPFGVAEYWDNATNTLHWVNEANEANYNPVDAFDFPLRELLKGMCDTYGFSLKNLVNGESVLKSQPQSAVTFVENHDLRDEGRPITNDKLLAYSYILTHEGYPCVFWQDYFTWNLAKEDTPNGIAALVQAHQDHAGGMSSVIYLDNTLYIMQRNGWDKRNGLLYVLNSKPTEEGWNGARVQTRWRNTTFKPIAWTSGCVAADVNDGPYEAPTSACRAHLAHRAQSGAQDRKSVV